MVSVNATQTDTQWRFVAENSYIDLDGLVGMEEFYGYSFLMKTFNKGQYEPIRNNAVWYTLAQYTIDCSNSTYKVGVIDSYGYENNFLNGDYNRYAGFRPIVEGTAIGTVASKVCRK